MKFLLTSFASIIFITEVESFSDEQLVEFGRLIKPKALRQLKSTGHHVQVGTKAILLQEHQTERSLSDMFDLKYYDRRVRKDSKSGHNKSSRSHHKEKHQHSHFSLSYSMWYGGTSKSRHNKSKRTSRPSSSRSKTESFLSHYEKGEDFPYFKPVSMLPEITAVPTPSPENLIMPSLVFPSHNSVSEPVSPSLIASEEHKTEFQVTSITCSSNASTVKQSQKVIDFVYSIETISPSIHSILQGLEYQMLEIAGAEVCNSSGNQRMLSATVDKIDSYPEDEILASCTPEIDGNNTCTQIKGYLTLSGDVDFVETSNILSIIEERCKDGTFTSQQVVKVNFLKKTDDFSISTSDGVSMLKSSGKDGSKSNWKISMSVGLVLCVAILAVLLSKKESVRKYFRMENEKSGLQLSDENDEINSKVTERSEEENLDEHGESIDDNPQYIEV